MIPLNLIDMKQITTKDGDKLWVPIWEDDGGQHNPDHTAVPDNDARGDSSTDGREVTEELNSG